MNKHLFGRILLLIVFGVFVVLILGIGSFNHPSRSVIVNMNKGEPKVFYLCDPLTNQTDKTVWGYGDPQPVNIMSPDFRPGIPRWEYSDQDFVTQFWTGRVAVAPQVCLEDPTTSSSTP